MNILIYVLIIFVFLFKSWLSFLNYKNRFAPIPEEVKDVYDETEYKKWLEYNMETFRFSNILRVVDLIVFIGLLVGGVFLYFEKLSLNFSNPGTQLLVFMGLYYLVSFVIGIITSYYDTFVLEERFGFNKSTKKTFILDKVKGLILTILLGGGILLLLFTLYTNTGNMFFVYAWGVLVGIILLMNILYVPVIVPLFNKLTPLEEGSLKEKIEALALTTGYNLDKISVMNASKRSTKLNAYFAGLGKSKRIVLFDTLIEKCSEEEIVSVLAHEIGHNKKKHILYNMIQMIILLSAYVAVLLLVLNKEFSMAFGFTDTNFGFALILFGVLMSPISILIGLITSYLSRLYEYQADAYAVKYAGSESMINVLKKLSRENFSNLTPHPLYVKLTYSHPPTSDRIKAIKKLA